MNIRKAETSDTDAIWKIIHRIIQSGDTYAFDPNSPKEKMMEFWMGNKTRTYVAEIENKIVGTFFMKENQPDLGSHVANAGYMVDPKYNGQGIGKAMGMFSLEEAKILGYKALQFNFVVSTNKWAINLWKKLGFSIIGTIPNGFQHKKLGYIDVLIMHREL